MIRNIIAGIGFVLGAVNAIGGEEAIIQIIIQHCEKKSEDNMRILHHETETIIRYVRTLFFLPFFDRERLTDLDNYKGKTLWVIASQNGNKIKYRTTDRFLRELTALEVEKEISFSLATCYYMTFYDIEGIPLYVDGYFKAVWTLKNIPKGKHGMMARIMPGRKLIFLNGHDGHPFLHRTCPGDRHLTKEILPIVEDFEKAIGREVANMIVVDGEGCSLELFKEFDEINKHRKMNTYLLTMMDTNQYRFNDLKVRDGSELRQIEDGDFVAYKYDKKGRIRSWVTLVEFDYLSNANRRRKNKTIYMVRCAVVKKKNGKLSVITTNQPYEETLSGAELADLYYNRWPCQEGKFKEMNRYCNLKKNHGYKKREVPNRTADKKLKEAEKSLKASIRMRNNLKKEYEKLEGQKQKRRTSMEKKKNEIEAKIRVIKHGLDEGRGTESTQLCLLQKRKNELNTLEEKHRVWMQKSEKRKKGLDERKKKYSKATKRFRADVDKWKKRLENTPLYELENEMDHIMTNFNILYENSLLYVKDTFFEGNVGMDKLMKQFLNHYGNLEILDRGKRYRFRLNKFDDKGLTKKARKACEKFNEMKIKTSDDILLEMVVKR